MQQRQFTIDGQFSVPYLTDSREIGVQFQGGRLDLGQIDFRQNKQVISYLFYFNLVLNDETQQILLQRGSRGSNGFIEVRVNDGRFEIDVEGAEAEISWRANSSVDQQRALSVLVGVTLDLQSNIRVNYWQGDNFSVELLQNNFAFENAAQPVVLFGQEGNNVVLNRFAILNSAGGIFLQQILQQNPHLITPIAIQSASRILGLRNRNISDGRERLLQTQ